MTKEDMRELIAITHIIVSENDFKQMPTIVQYDGH
jgi:hypothetical protein